MTEKVAENGALICKVCDTKVIISEELAKNIIIGDCHEDKKKFLLLSQLSAGQKAVIADFYEENDACARLEEMGVTPGEKIEVVRRAKARRSKLYYVREKAVRDIRRKMKSVTQTKEVEETEE